MDVGAHVRSLLQGHMGDAEASLVMERKLQKRTLAIEGRRRGRDSGGVAKLAWAERSSKGYARPPTHVKPLSGKGRKVIERRQGGGGEAWLGEETIARLQDAWHMHASDLRSAGRGEVLGELVLLGAHAVVLYSTNAAQVDLRGTIVKETERTWTILPVGKRRARCIPKVTTVLGVPVEDGVLVVDGPTAADRFRRQRKAPLSKEERKKTARATPVVNRRDAFLAYHAFRRREDAPSSAQGAP